MTTEFRHATIGQPSSSPPSRTRILLATLTAGGTYAIGFFATSVLLVAVGALIRSQVMAITTSLAWMFLVENLATAIDYRTGRWFPFQALNAIFISQDALAGDPGSVLPLAPALGLAVSSPTSRSPPPGRASW